MAKTESVLVCVSLVVTAPVSEALPEDAVMDALQEAFLDSVADRISSLAVDLAHEPWCEKGPSVTYFYLSPENEVGEKNAARCARCGRWTSDCEAPDFLAMWVGQDGPWQPGVQRVPNVGPIRARPTGDHTW